MLPINQGYRCIGRSKGLSRGAHRGNRDTGLQPLLSDGSRSTPDSDIPDQIFAGTNDIEQNSAGSVDFELDEDTAKTGQI